MSDIVEFVKDTRSDLLTGNWPELTHIPFNRSHAARYLRRNKPILTHKPLLGRSE